MQEDKIFQYPLAACERQDLNGGKGVVERWELNTQLPNFNLLVIYKNIREKYPHIYKSGSKKTCPEFILNKEPDNKKKETTYFQRHTM